MFTSSLKELRSLYLGADGSRVLESWVEQFQFVMYHLVCLGECHSGHQVYDLCCDVPF